ncbi:MAG: UDP-N-acetylmuramoyl-L-alanyl-D-glutamate--2,6-diaminopimelate ligase [Betaproteobacteria bacterium]|nr:UDP-N-acetylmuramoyl-L-alanyl-D-glutamate--2,6-diaminopimelate ligase [Betaproteobacteria bacterium]
MAHATVSPGALAALGADLTRMVSDSRRVRAGDVFVALPGARHDPRMDIPGVIAAGAAAVIWEQEGFRWREEWRVPNLPVRGLRNVLGELVSQAYSHPSRQMWVAGVTGTNGKTSCSQWLAHVLTQLGRRTAVIGTLGNGFPGELSPASHTTPDVVTLHQLLADYRSHGATSVAMEVSSHGLDQGRVDGVQFSAALFTNLTRDHLDYHGSMERYGAAKARLFAWPTLKHAVVNLDDEFGANLAARLNRGALEVMGYGIGRGEISGHRLDLSSRGLRLEIETPWGKSEIESQLLGGFNASNLLGVLGMLLAAGAGLADATRTLSAMQAVPGRLQIVRESQGPLVVVDYAHTPDALEKVLQTLADIKPAGARLICVFGCGGNRDAGKRPLMGEIATRLADLAVVTSDNPRDEEPLKIIENIIAGAHGNYRVEADRAAAIHRAIEEARPNDIVLLAGKGHETHQEIRGARLPFADVEVARDFLRRHHA